jgi:hypothetical protein
MRPLAAILVWVIVLGGVALFMHARKDLAANGTASERAAEGHFAVDVTVSFSAEADPFALDASDESGGLALLLRVNGQDVLRRSDRITAGEPLRIEPVPGIVIGENEFYLEANPPLDQAGREHAIRVRVLHDGQPIAEQTFWSSPGARVANAFRIGVRAPGEPTDDAHEH